MTVENGSGFTPEQFDADIERAAKAVAAAACIERPYEELDDSRKAYWRHLVRAAFDASNYTIMKEVIIEANNSLFGSHGFFIGTPPEKYHLANAIEGLKAAARKGGDV